MLDQYVEGQATASIPRSRVDRRVAEQSFVLRTAVEQAIQAASTAAVLYRLLDAVSEADFYSELAADLSALKERLRAVRYE